MNKKNKIKIILLLTILLLGLFLTINFAKAGVTGTWEEEATKDRALEIVYPQIPGVTTPKVVSTGLPEYVAYIFRFSVILIGLVILGALIYSGFQYFTSFGNPEKFSAAKNGIISAFLGGIILLGAVLIFNTINPQLVILEAPPLSVLEPTVMPGIYLCNKKVDNIDGIIGAYISNDKDLRLEAVKEFMEVMQNDKGACFRVPGSGNLKIGNIKKFEFDPINQTVFAIPRENLNAKTISEKWVYDYGIIFHEKDNYQGLCRLAIPYQKADPSMVLGVEKVRSVTLFQKLEEAPSSTSKGVILYRCLNYEDPTSCPAGITTTAGTPFPPGDDIREVSNEELGELASGMGTEWVTGGFWIFKIKYYQKQRVEDKTAGARSIKIDPVGSFFAVLLGQNLVKYKSSSENPNGLFCEVITNDDPNLLDNDIGRCGDKCQIVSSKDETKDWQIQSCYSCLRAMAVIKGQVLK